MKPAIAKVMDSSAAEELGRATLQIVHDLKNQINGLKLYATFLRKRFERDDRSVEERETLAKLIAGLDIAAKEMTSLVRYARPVELRRRPHADLRKLILSAAEPPHRDSGGLEPRPVTLHVEDTGMFGEFDDILLGEALTAITSEVRHSLSPKDAAVVSVHLHREGDEAVCEWRGGKLSLRHQPINNANGCGTIHTALAAKIIEAHGGRVLCDENLIQAWLPLTDKEQFPNHEQSKTR